MRLGAAAHVGNELAAFVLEVLALGALAWSGADAGGAVAAIAAPVVAAVVWGLFAAPKARFPVAMGYLLLVKAVVFGAATAGLALVGRPVLGGVFGGLALVNTGLASVDRRALINTSR